METKSQSIDVVQEPPKLSITSIVRNKLFSGNKSYLLVDSDASTLIDRIVGLCEVAQNAFNRRLVDRIEDCVDGLTITLCVTWIATNPDVAEVYFVDTNGVRTGPLICYFSVLYYAARRVNLRQDVDDSLDLDYKYSQLKRFHSQFRWCIDVMEVSRTSNKRNREMVDDVLFEKVDELIKSELTKLLAFNNEFKFIFPELQKYIPKKDEANSSEMHVSSKQRQSEGEPFPKYGIEKNGIFYWLLREKNELFYVIERLSSEGIIIFGSHNYASKNSVADFFYREKRLCVWGVLPDSSGRFYASWIKSRQKRECDPLFYIYLKQLLQK